MRRNLSRIPLLIVPVLLIGLTGWLHYSVVNGQAPLSPDNVDWKTPRHISTNASNGAFNPIIKRAPNGVLTIMYNHGLASGVPSPNYSQSINDGATWSTPLAVHSSANPLLQVRFEFDANSVGHAIWRDDNGRLFHARQNQWGTGNATTIVDTGQLIFDPNIAIAPNGALHVVWSQGETLDALNIYHAFSQNGGQSWTVSPPLVADAAQASSVPAVAVTSNGTVHAVWEGRIFDPAIPGFVRAINYKKRAGGVWDSQATILSASLNENARRPSIIAEGNNVHVAFTRQVSNNEQYPYYMMHNGVSWSTPVDTSNGMSVVVNAQSPFFLVGAMAACGGNIYLYYHGALGAGAPEQLLGSNKKNGWPPRDQVTDGTQRTVNPSMVCSNGVLQIVYEEILTANVNHQVYHVIGWGNLIYLPIISR